MSKPRAGIIDVGTNSVKFLIAEHNNKTGLSVIHFAKETTRIGSGMTKSGRLSAKGLTATIDAVKRFRRHLHSDDNVVAFGTHALRDAANQARSLRRFHKETGIELRVLTVREESEMAFRNARRFAAGSHRPCVIADSGGGSTEVVYGSGSRIRRQSSIPWGALNCTEAFLASDPPAAKEMARLRSQLERRLRSLAGWAPKERPTLLLSGGSASSLADLLQPNHGYRDSVRFTRGQVRRLLHELSRMRLAQRRRVRGLAPERADIMVAGATIVDIIMQCLGKRVAHAIPGGVREGMALTILETES